MKFDSEVLRQAVAALPDGQDAGSLLALKSSLPPDAGWLLEAEYQARLGATEDALALYRLAGARIEDAAALGLTALGELLEKNFSQAIRRGDGCRDARLWRQAAEHYEFALELRPAANFARVQLAHAHKEAGDLASAISCYEEAIRREPDSDDIYLHMGHAFKLRRDIPAAADAYGCSLRLNPGNADARRELEALGLLPPTPAISADAAGTKADLVFRLDPVHLNRISGYALNPADAGKPLILELVWADTAVLTFVADLPRSDLSSAGVKANHGFEVHVPGWLCDGELRLLAIRSAETHRGLGESFAFRFRQPNAPEPYLELLSSLERIRQEISDLKGRVQNYYRSTSFAGEDYDSFFRAYSRLQPEDIEHLRELVRERPVRLAFVAAAEPDRSGAVGWAEPRRIFQQAAGQRHVSWELVVGAPEDAQPPSGWQEDPRITIRSEEPHGGRGRLAAALDALDPEAVVVLLEPGAELSPDAGLLFAAAFATLGPDAAYGDHDRVEEGHHHAPVFGPDYDELLALQADVIGPVLAAKARAVQSLRDLGEGADAITPRIVALRLSEQEGPKRLLHIPRVLGHRTPRSPATAGALSATVVRRHLVRQGVLAAVEGAEAESCRITFAVPNPLPLVSIIIPMKDQSEVLAQCLAGLSTVTDYAALEITIVNHESTETVSTRLLEIAARDPRVRVVEASGDFNWSRLNNEAAARAPGDFLLFLNSDTLAFRRDWLRRMVSYSALPRLGAVGAKLLNADGGLQHAGMALGFRGGAGNLAPRRGGKGGIDWAAVPRQASAVTGAAMLVPRKVFEGHGGFDERFAVALNDVDFCLRLNASGLKVIYAADVELFHLDARTRGHDHDYRKRARLRQEVALFEDRWRSFPGRDPFYNENYDAAPPGFARFTAPRPIKAWLDDRHAEPL